MYDECAGASRGFTGDSLQETMQGAPVVRHGSLGGFGLEKQKTCVAFIDDEVHLQPLPVPEEV